MRAAFAAAAAGTTAYPGEAPPEPSRLPNDWRRFLDLVQGEGEVADEAEVTGLVAEVALDEADRQLLPARASARRAYAGPGRGGWRVGGPGRRPDGDGPLGLRRGDGGHGPGGRRPRGPRRDRRAAAAGGPGARRGPRGGLPGGREHRGAGRGRGACGPQPRGAASRSPGRPMPSRPRGTGSPSWVSTGPIPRPAWRRRAPPGRRADLEAAEAAAAGARRAAAGRPRRRAGRRS